MFRTFYVIFGVLVVILTLPGKYANILRFHELVELKRKDEIMQKVICKVQYDTEKSELVLKKVFGSFGDPSGYEESLYKTENGKFFLYVNGGENSPYKKEDIKRMSADKANDWIKA